MLEIINQKGQVLQFSDDVSIPVERNNMLFNDGDKLTQDVVYPFDAPLSHANKLFIKHGHLVDADNDVYTIKVQAFTQSQVLFDGNLVYTIKGDKINATLKPNFAGLAAKVANSRLNQIDFADQQEYLSGTALATLMKNTCLNPDDYGFIFVPLWNTRLGLSFPSNPSSNPYVNQFNTATNVFAVENTAPGYVYNTNAQNTPFLKLLYVLKSIGKVLGFNNITGNWQNSPEAKTTYTYNLRHLYTTIGATLNMQYDTHSFGYMLPNMTIAEFLKAARIRFNLSFDFDSTKGEFKIENFEGALNQPIIDINDYLEAVSEINIPAEKGYQISLKVDEKDTAWNTGTVDDPKYLPNYDLLIGDAKEKIEIPAGTLRNHQQGLYKSIASQLLKDDIIANNNEYNDANNFDLRFFKYDGYLHIESDKFWPQSSALDIDLQKAKLYSYLNSAKQYRLAANIPSTVILQITGTSIISFVSKEGAYVKAIVEKIRYDLKSKQQYIKSEIICRSLNMREKSKPILRDNFAVINTTTYKVLSYKSNFKGLLPIITIHTTSFVDTINLTTSKNMEPCDVYGIGGQDQLCYQPTDLNTYLYDTIVFTINQGVPKFLIFLAKKAAFALQLDGTYVASMPRQDFYLNGLSYFIKY
jgi:hypothetical protein